MLKVKKNSLFLAPMAGITDTVFRLICKEMGADMVYTEFVSANGIIRENKKTLDMMQFKETERPLGIQIFGDSASVLGESAKIIREQFDPDIIDINFGCPVPKITTKGAGSGAMKNMSLMAKMAEAVVKESKDTPVTVKMRAGWCDGDIISTEAGTMLESVGIQAITLHPRTSKQRFTGKSNWSLIKELKDSVSIPVIGNGDVDSPEKYIDMVEETNCDAVMIARASLGNPWIFTQIKDLRETGDYKQVTTNSRIELCKRHYQLLKHEKNEGLCLNLTKKHYSWYLKGFPNAALWRTRFMKCQNLEEIETILDDMSDSFD
ncbi:MAG: tRNA dihydrouridine synthase DusB [Candidatus Marinimicrobia bacterium]|nr:tRNA dihydrouridine synthase DusB [Candidatus Neomarinimicrobiota bacterium]|tara:strand:+ start:577 stop:1536 length:960 start_codon:yes stop_codon:yes gene_type:complete